MGTFVGLDVSLKATSICVLDEAGTRVFEGKAAADPAVLARLIRKRAPEVVRVGLESGPTSAWHCYVKRIWPARRRPARVAA
jgi:transposase